MGLAGKQIKTIPLVVIPPPIITARDITVGCTMIDAATRAAAQIIAPMIERPIPIIIFNSDVP